MVGGHDRQYRANSLLTASLFSVNEKKIKWQLTQFLSNHRTLTDVSLSDSGRKAVD